MQKLDLKECKGVILPVLILMAKVSRPVSVTYLVDELDSSDKTIGKALRKLQKKEIVMQVGRLYQYCGDEYQLPLYWGETVEALNPSPASEQPPLFELGSGAENFSRKNSGLGFESAAGVSVIPSVKKSGNFPGLEQRVMDLERRVSVLEGGISSVIGKIPAENGVFSDVNLTTTRSINPENDDKQVVVLEAEKIPESEEIPENDVPAEKFETQEEYLQLMRELQDYYKQRDHFGCPVFKDYALIPDDVMEKVAEMRPDCRVLEYILPRTAYADVLFEWCGLSFQEAKKKLLAEVGIFGKYEGQIMANTDISLVEIDYHYWKWKLYEEKDHPEWKIQMIGHRIANQFDRQSARTSDPLKFGWIE